MRPPGDLNYRKMLPIESMASNESPTLTLQVYAITKLQTAKIIPT